MNLFVWVSSGGFCLYFYIIPLGGIGPGSSVLHRLCTVFFLNGGVAALDNKYRYTTLTKNGHGSEVVSALGFKRSGPGFDSRRP